MNSQPFESFLFFKAVVILMGFNHVGNYFYEMRIGRWVHTWLRLQLTHQRAVALFFIDFHKEVLGGELVLEWRQKVTIGGKCFIEMSSVAQ